MYIILHYVVCVCVCVCVCACVRVCVRACVRVHGLTPCHRLSEVILAPDEQTCLSSQEL